MGLTEPPSIFFVRLIESRTRQRKIVQKGDLLAYIVRTAVSAAVD